MRFKQRSRLLPHLELVLGTTVCLSRWGCVLILSPPTYERRGSRNQCTNQPDRCEWVTTGHCERSYLFTGHRMPDEVVLPENHALLLEDIIPPNTVHFPHAFPIRRPILAPGLSTRRVQDRAGSAAGWNGERASPVSHFSRITGCKQKRLEGGCWECVHMGSSGRGD